MVSTAGDNIIWFKGGVVPARKAVVNVMSPTAQFGLNVFEGIRGYWSEPDEAIYIFRLDDHLNRLFDSCKLLGLECKYTALDIKGFVNELVNACGLRSDIALRLTLFADGEGSWSSVEPPDLFISPILKPRRDADMLSGMSACISSWRRIDDTSMPPRVKTGANYVAGRYAYLEANRAGYDLPIFLNATGKVSEGTGACIFMICDQVLVTPTLQSSVLPSITRDTLLRLSEDLGLRAVVREIERTELFLADELFLCGTAAEITPITAINGVTIGDGQPGKITIKLLKAYHELLTNRFKGKLPMSWLTKIPMS